MSGPELVGNIIQQSLDKMGLLAKAKRYLVFWAWSDMVGEIARNARPRRIDGDVLYVATTSAAWAQELTLMRKSIISRINEYLGGNYIRDIRFSEHLWGTAKDLGDPDLSREGGRTDREYRQFMSGDVLTPDEMRRIDDIAREGGDPDLRSAFQSFAVTMEKRKKYLLKEGFTKCDACGYLCRPGHPCPYCKARREREDFYSVLAVLERHPETSDITLAVMTGIRQKEIFARARQTLDARWDRELRRGYFAAATSRLGTQEQARLRQVALKLASLRTGQPAHELSQEDLDKVLGTKLAGLAKVRHGKKQLTGPEPNIDSV